MEAVSNRTTPDVVERNNKSRSEGRRGKRTYQKGAIFFPLPETTLMKILVVAHGIHL